MPSIRKSIEKNDIEEARQRLLEAIYDELPDDRHLGREAVKQLLSTLIAARERGLGFDRIAEILKKARVDVAAVTLRRYFFELKTESELAAETARHTKKVAETRRAIQEKFLALHTDHGDSLTAQRFAKPTPRFTTFLGDKAPDPVTTASVSERPQVTEKDARARENARPASPAAPVPPQAAEPARKESEVVVPETVGVVKPASGLPTSEKPHRAAPGGRSESAVTLADVEQASLATEERTELLGDLELREGDFVFYVSGQPFHGFLTKGQIRLLRTVGRVIAPTVGKSSKDFVTMPAKL